MAKLLKCAKTLMAFLLTFVVTVRCSVFGGKPTGSRLERVQKSQQYNLDKKNFRNPNPNFSMGGDYWGMFREMLGGQQVRSPTRPLTEVQPDIEGIKHDSTRVKFIWFGHSSFLLRMSGKSILIDPVFGPYASPVAIFGKRFQPALVQASRFDSIDLIVISHDHYDHLEMETIKHFAPTETHFAVPLGVGAHLESWGISPDRITEMDWWSQAEVAGISLTCTPAQHFSGRSGLDSNRTLWASWVIQDRRDKIFYSGDSGYSAHFKEIGDRLGPFDLTFLENGQYNMRWKDVHQLPEEAVAAHLDLKGRILVPVHWGAYVLAFHDWFEPIERITREASKQKIELLIPRLGETVDLAATIPTEHWWQATPDWKR